MQSETVKYFQALSYEEILAQRPGNWGDYELGTKDPESEIEPKPSWYKKRRRGRSKKKKGRR